MTHPSDLLERYAAGQLPTAMLVAIDGHLEQCSECLARLAPPREIDLAAVWAAIAADLDLDEAMAAPTDTRPDTPQEPTAAQAGDRSLREPRRRVSWLHRPVAVFAATAAAALIVIGGAVWLLAPSDAPPVVTDPPPTVTTTAPTTTAPTTTKPTTTPPDRPGPDAVASGTALITSIDTAGNTGWQPSMVIASDGRPVIAYFDFSEGVAKVATCTTNDCTGESVITALGPASDWIRPSPALTPNGLPVIAYATMSNDGGTTSGIVLARCTTADCTTFTAEPLPVDVGASASSLSLLIGADGRPLLIYSDGDLRAVACADPECTEATVTTIDPARVEMMDGIADATVGLDGRPIVAYVSGSTLKLAVCDDPRCATGASTTALLEGAIDSALALTLTSGGAPVITYVPPTEITGSPTVGLVTCSDPVCSDFAAVEVEVGAAAAAAAVVGPGDLPVVATVFRDINIVSCGDAQCSGPTTTSRLDTEAPPFRPSVVIGADGLPRIAYGAGSDLKLATCTALPCVTEEPPPPPVGVGRITTIVSEGDAELIGANPSLVVDADGLPMVMYTVGQENPRPKLIRCLDAACSLSTSREVAVGGFHNTLAITPAGLPVIAHHDWERVMLTYCDDATCNTTSTVELEASEFAYYEPVAIAFDQSGAPIVAFQNGNDYYIHVAACDDAACTSWSSGRVETFAAADNTRWYTNTVDIVIPGDGLPVVAASQNDGAVRIAKCTDRACTESAATILDDTGLDTLTADMALGSDDLPLVAYYSDGDLRVAKCLNTLCTDFTVNVVGEGLAEFIASVAPSIAIGDDGLPVIGYWAPGRTITLAGCSDLACASSTVTTFGQENTFSLVLGADGRPLLAYHDSPELVVTKCGDAVCGAEG